MSNIGFIAGIVGGMLLIAGGSLGQIDADLSEYLTRLTYELVPSVAEDIITAVTYLAQMGGFTVIGGTIIARFIAETPGKIIMVTGFASGVVPVVTVIYSAIGTGELQMTFNSIQTFFLSQGQGFLGITLSIIGFMIVAKD